jgi:hypothetical protein
VSFREETTFGELAQGYRYWVRAGDRVATVELDGIPEITLPVAQKMVEAQLACFEDVTCLEPIPVSELLRAEAGAPSAPPATPAAATPVTTATPVAPLTGPVSDDQRASNAAWTPPCFLDSWGQDPDGSGSFNPYGVAVASDGTVYVTNPLAHRVRSFTADGTALDEWGSQGADAGQFNTPTGIAVAPDGIVYVADTGNSRVQYFDITGTFLGGGGARVAAMGKSQAAAATRGPDLSASPWLPTGPSTSRMRATIGSSTSTRPGPTWVNGAASEAATGSSTGRPASPWPPMARSTLSTKATTASRPLTRLAPS